uniref:Uncharacterized protein n=1 Tax=Timema bartmani TaxID=61472 RepID=A0A7R9F2V1_9NEOP|nr:unnamed protein product [Timema bartmani]
MIVKNKPTFPTNKPPLMVTRSKALRYNRLYSFDGRTGSSNLSWVNCGGNGLKKGIFRGNEPEFAWKESGKTYLSTPDLDSNLVLPVLSSRIDCEIDALYHAATEVLNVSDLRSNQRRSVGNCLGKPSDLFSFRKQQEGETGGGRGNVYIDRETKRISEPSVHSPPK